MAPPAWHGTRSLATECYEAADGDFEIALLLALDYITKFGGSEPRAQETARTSSINLNLGACSLADAPSGPPEERAAA